MALQPWNFLKPYGSDNHFLIPSWTRITVQRLDDRQLRWLGVGRLVHMQREPICPAKGGGHPALNGEDVA